MIEPITSLASGVFSGVEAAADRYGMTILLLSIGIAVYAAIVGKFYHYLSRRVLYETHPDNTRGISGIVHRFGSFAALILTYTVLFPAISFAWFIIISTFVFLLSSKSDIETVFVLSISVVAAIRILAYYKEEIAMEVAKLLPLVFLGIMIIEPTVFTRALVEERTTLLAGSLPEYFAIIVFVIGLEWALRILYTIAKYAHLAHSEWEKK